MRRRGRLPQRPELSHESVPLEYCSRFRCVRPLPAVVEPRRIPFCAQLEDPLRRNRSAKRQPARAKPASQFAIRPEGDNVRSGVADVIPEVTRPNKEMNNAVSAHDPA